MTKPETRRDAFRHHNSLKWFCTAGLPRQTLQPVHDRRQLRKLGTAPKAKASFKKKTLEGLGSRLSREVLAAQVWRREFRCQSTYKHQLHWCVSRTPALGKWGQEDHWGSLASHPSLIGSSRSGERLCPKNKAEGDQKTYSTSASGLYTYTHRGTDTHMHTHVHTYIHTHVHAHTCRNMHKYMHAHACIYIHAFGKKKFKRQ